MRLLLRHGWLIRGCAACALTLPMGCGSSGPVDEPTSLAHTEERTSGEELRAEPVSAADLLAAAAPVASEDVAPATAPVASEDVPPPAAQACAGLGWSACAAARTRCIWEGACREPVDDCETITPSPSWSGEPVFSAGDPCENVRPGCGWNPATRRCAPFSQVAACPATLDDARDATVLCNHSAQPELACRYGSTRCLCHAPVYCGGAPPPPTMTPFPRAFTCIPPVDARGCPTGTIRNGTPCRVSPSIECSSCSTSAQCVGGRWRVLRLPPRP